MFLWRNKDLGKEKDPENASKFSHLVNICAYKDPLEVISMTLSSLATQSQAKTALYVVMALEEKTPELTEKIIELDIRFKSKFQRLIFSIHPYGVEGEIPGERERRQKSH